ECIAVVDARQVDACARVTVPVPHTADVASGFESEDLEAHLAKLVDRVHAAKSGADDDHVEAFGAGFTGLRCVLAAHVRTFDGSLSRCFAEMTCSLRAAAALGSAAAESRCD